MNFNILEHLNIFFAIIMCVLYFAFVFCAKKTESKFFIFFISSFVNIFNYSIVLKNEYNFLSVVLLNLMFVFIIIFFYIYCDVNNNILSNDFVESSDAKNLITIIIFILSFISLCFIFNSLYTRKDRLTNKPLTNNIIATSNIVIKNSNIKQEKQTIKIEKTNYIIYNRNIRFLNNNKVFHNYNLIILFYIIAIMTSFFINNSNIKK